MNPMMVEVTRGGIVESEHRVHVAIASHDGIEVQGDGERLTFPRSAAKLMQALPLVESGAAHRAGLTPEQLALACASHGGESAHVNAVEAWLTELGLTEAHLECGPSWPMHEPSGHARSAQGLGASLLCNCCSGKHAGFMTLAKDQGVDVAGYIQREHPVQQQIEATIGEVLDTPVGVFGVDGCGIPTYANRLMDLAAGLQRLASATGVRGDAVKTLAAAHRAHPFMVGGTDRCCTDINGALADGMVKYGAEGVYFGLFPKAGLGMAMKAECGTVRAVEVAMVRVLKQHGLLPANALPQWDSVSLKNRAGLVVGEIRA